MKYGTGIKVWFVPLHLLITRLDQNNSDVLLKAHILTRCDLTSENGTKSAALKSNPFMYLKSFGENKLPQPFFVDAKVYLIKVLQSNIITLY